MNAESLSHLISGGALGALGVLGGAVGTYLAILGARTPREREFTVRAVVVGWLLTAGFVGALIFLADRYRLPLCGACVLLFALGGYGWRRKLLRLRREEFGAPPPQSVTPGRPGAMNGTAGAATATAGRPVILCVDDEEAILDALERALRKLDVEIAKATSGAMALGMIANRMVRPSLIILDLHMPIMNGFEFLKRLPAGFRRAVPIVILTGDRSDESLISGYQDGATYFMTKPFENLQVVKIVRYLLAQPANPEQRLRLEGSL